MVEVCGGKITGLDGENVCRITGLSTFNVRENAFWMYGSEVFHGITTKRPLYALASAAVAEAHEATRTTLVHELRGELQQEGQLPPLCTYIDRLAPVEVMVSEGLATCSDSIPEVAGISLKAARTS